MNGDLFSGYMTIPAPDKVHKGLTENRMIYPQYFYINYDK